MGQKTKPQNGYSVGYDHSTNMVTLRLNADDGYYMSISLSGSEVDRMVRLLLAAKNTDEPPEPSTHS